MPDILNILIPSIISLIALGFSISSFLRDRTFHNANSLYEAKLQAYQAVIRLLTHYLSEVEDILQPLVDFENNPDQELLKRLGAKEDLVNSITYRLKDDLTEFRFLASASVDEKLDAFIDYLLYDNPEFETIEQYIAYSKKVIDTLYQQAEDIAKIMHKEMNVTPLNEQLFKRLTKKASKFTAKEPA